MQAQRGNRPIAVLIFNIGAGKGRYIYAHRVLNYMYGQAQLVA